MVVGLSWIKVLEAEMCEEEKVVRWKWVASNRHD